VRVCVCVCACVCVCVCVFNDPSGYPDLLYGHREVALLSTCLSRGKFTKIIMLVFQGGEIKK
jgi:hypothetical protein